MFSNGNAPLSAASFCSVVALAATILALGATGLAAGFLATGGLTGTSLVVVFWRLPTGLLAAD